MATTEVRRVIRAPRAQVYEALLDPVAVRHWMVPDGMTSEVHAFDAREGGHFRISLTYEEEGATGKTSAHTDTHHGRFARLVPDELVVQVVEFETDDPGLQGEMTITYRLSPEGDGTLVVGTHEGLPEAVDPAQNELGWSMSLAKLAGLVEGGR
jgi:uncharacterized protein YndB with AHSA1/START domain